MEEKDLPSDLGEPATATIRLSPPNRAAPLEGAVTALDKNKTQLGRDDKRGPAATECHSDANQRRGPLSVIATRSYRAEEWPSLCAPGN